MRRYLKHAVSRCVYNRLAGLYMLLAKFLDNLCAGGCFVSKIIKACLFFKTIQYFLWKSMRVCWKRLINNKPCNLPMACGCIFAFGCLCHPAIRGDRFFYFLQPFTPLNKAKSHGFKVWQMNTPKGFYYISKGVTAFVVIVFGVRQFTNAHAVQDKKDYSIYFAVFHVNYCSGRSCLLPPPSGGNS